MPKRSNREELEQIALMEWVGFARSRTGDDRLDMLYHTPSGMPTSKRSAARFQKMGMKPHVPDLHLPVPVDGVPGLWIEMKVLPACAKKTEIGTCKAPVRVSDVEEADEDNLLGRVRGVCTVCGGETNRGVATLCDPGQVDMIFRLREFGFWAVVCVGMPDAARTIAEYLDLPNDLLAWVV